MLRNFLFYRKWKGGTWWLVRFPGGDQWVNTVPLKQLIIDTEDYTNKNNQVYSDSEFYVAIANIPRNGGWKEQQNLRKYLKIARFLRQRGVEDKLIIDWCTELYRAAYREQTTKNPSRYFSREEILALAKQPSDVCGN